MSVPVRDLLELELDRIEALYNGDADMRVTTGLPSIDAALCGLWPGEVVVVTGAAGSGKSALLHALTVASTQRDGRTVMLWSLELPGPAVVQRLLAQASGVDLGRLVGGELTDADWPRLTKAIGVLGARSIYIDSSRRISVDELWGRLVRDSRSCRPTLLLVDGLQMASDGAQSAGFTALWRLRLLAADLAMPVIVTITGDAHDLLEAGSRAAMADAVVHLTRLDQDRVNVAVRKSRYGPPNETTVVLNPSSLRFDHVSTASDGVE